MNRNTNTSQWLVASDQLGKGEFASRVYELQPSASSLPRPLLATSHQPPATRGVPRRAPRGVLLLVVLSLLVLFTLIGVTFVLVASQSRRATRADSRHEQYGDDPRRVVDAVFGQIVRDTTNPRSSLQGHSLLADMYGNDGVKMVDGAPMTVTPAAAGQFLDLAVNGTPTTAANPPIDLRSVPRPLLNCPLSLPQIQTPGYFNGCVATFLDGPAANVSTRIVGWNYTGGTYFIRVMAIEGFTAASLNNIAVGILINGRPFNGTGFGFNPAENPTTAPTLLTNQTEISVPSLPLPITGQFPSVFLPNSVFHNRTPATFAAVSGTPPYATQFPFSSALGGADEDYDASDPQNLLLAYMPINPQPVALGVQSQIFPSLHRPDTFGYVYNRAAFPTDTMGHEARKLVIRQAMLRPFGPMTVGGVALPFPYTDTDHPNFTGGNPNFDAVLGPWDVDNDSDGIADSIWVDMGLPVQTAADGRRFKPLAAILCIDMDGRLNVNAHGNIAQVNPNFAAPITPGTSPNLTIADAVFASSPPATLTPSLPRGSGYGPPEINLGLGGIFQNPAIDYPNFLRGMNIGSRSFEGRYGEYGLTSAMYPYPQPGGTIAPPRADNILDLIKRFDFPDNYYTSPATSYGTPADLWGRAVLGIDYAGQPIYSFLQQATALQNGVIGVADPDLDPNLPNDPYAINLSRRRIRGSSQVIPTPEDNAFTVAELERILRKFDLDAQILPDRLQSLLNPTNSNPNDYGRMITTESNDLPSPGIAPTKDMATLLQGQSQVLNTIPSGLQLVDLLRAKVMQAGGYTMPTDQVAIDTLVTAMANPLNPARILAPELMAGQRFDLNRPFGNGEDDNPAAPYGGGVVDEPGEYSVKQEAPTRWTTAFGTAVPLDLNNDNSFDNNDMLARQQYAKYLYVLMMLFADHQYLWAQDNGANVALNVQEELTARRIAQWAVNVVDFRDPDSIMTPFEYDMRPFDGWGVDGDISTPDVDPQRRVVWGCEYPDLLITETIATHDRRVRDSQTDNGENGPQNDRSDSVNNMMPDTDYDQVRVPQGSVFFELYCPRSGNASQRVYSGELYSGGQLDLGKLAPADAGGLQYPVWRIAITASRATGANQPNDINARLLLHPDTTNFDPVSLGTDPLNYSVFSPANSNPAPISIERLVWFSSQPPTATHIGYDLIYYNNGGMATLLSPGRHALIGPRSRTFFGKGGAAGNSTQRILLSPSVGTYDTAGTEYYTSNGITPPLSIICTSGRYPASLPPWDATSAPEFMGVNVSEPLFSAANYYPVPTAANYTYSTPLDVPLDSKAGAPLYTDKTVIPGILATGTTPNYKTALLQRLANPLVPFDDIINPYITIDWQPIDLTVFNGESLQTGGANHEDPDDPLFQTPPASIVAGSRERGSPTPTDANLWTVQPQQQTTATSLKAGSPAIFDYNLTHSLGYLNRALGSVWTTPPANQAAYAGAPNPTIAGANTFPWLAWNNRPFVSNMELLQVPATSAEQLVRQFSSTPTGSPAPYDAATPTNFHAPCKHLLNFFMSSQNGTAGAAPYFYRALDYVHVPSRFVGTETYMNPSSGVNGFRPPFNKVSDYRDPGRVNINTIPTFGAGGNSPIWDAIVNTPTPPWLEIVSSRRGDALTSVTAFGTLPSVFAHPFRTAGGASFGLPGAPLFTAEIDATLMRRYPANNTGSPLFEFKSAFATPYTNPDRNSYFRYMPLQRLSNLLTTRSNVYAVWVTVGFFEVSPNQGTGVIDAAHPEGFQLGQEIGSETGEVKRRRAFYIYDRTIPVGFEPGKDHNIDQGTLIKRFIE